MKIINAWSPTGGDFAGDIMLRYNFEGRKRIDHITSPEWYFFVDKNEPIREILKTLPIKGTKDGEKYIKVIMDKTKWKDPAVTEVVRTIHASGFKTYEADVGPAKRYIIDKKIEIEDFDKINLWYIDIETDDSSGNIEYEMYKGRQSIKAKDRILSIALVSKEGKEVFFCYEDEREMLIEFNKYLVDIDMLVGWNSKDFDIPYIWKRMMKHKISTSYIRNILHEDMMERVRYFYSKDPEARQNITSYSLDSISKYFLGESKVERNGKVIDLMKSDPVKFKEYNITDARLLKKLEDKLGLINLTYQMFQMCNCTAQNWTMVKALDNFILTEANSHKIHYPTNEAYLKDDDEEEIEIEEYLGAYVLDPVPGYYRDVYDLDFKSLYPNIIRTFNISPETLEQIHGADGIDTPGTEVEGKIRGRCTYTYEQGVIPRKIKLLLEEREKIRKEQKKHNKDSVEYRDLNVKQLVVKELANSIYGIIGNKYFRGFNINIAESITATGQYLIKTLQKEFNGKGHQVIYGDTDSLFIILSGNKDIKKVLDETNSWIETHLRKTYRVRECTIQLDLDKKFDKFLIVSKKKYVGLSDGKMKYVGLECIKRDNIPVATRAQKELIDLIFKESKVDAIHAFIRETSLQIKTQTFDPMDITIHKKMAKDAESYKGKTDIRKYTPPIHVRIAKNLKSKGGDKTDLTKSGSIISFIHTNGSTDGVHISDFKGEWDRAHYWNALVYPQLERILKHVYPDEDWIQYCDETHTKRPRKKDGEGSLLQEVLPTGSSVLRKDNLGTRPNIRRKTIK